MAKDYAGNKGLKDIFKRIKPKSKPKPERVFFHKPKHQIDPIKLKDWSVVFDHDRYRGLDSITYIYKRTDRWLDISKEKLLLLRSAFGYGASDEEACAFAEITLNKLYAYQRRYPDYKQQKEAYKRLPELTARKAVVDELSKNPDLSLKYLERKRKHEFSVKTVIDTVDKTRDHYEDIKQELGITQDQLDKDNINE